MEKKVVQESGKQARVVKLARVCNLCKQRYIAHSKFERFCQGCKSGSELYHFHECFRAS